MCRCDWLTPGENGCYAPLGLDCLEVAVPLPMPGVIDIALFQSGILTKTLHTTTHIINTHIFSIQKNYENNLP